MSVRDHNQIVIRDFKGRWKRGQPESCPIDHAIDEVNCIFTKNGLEPRPGITQLSSITASHNIVRMQVYHRNDGDRILALDTVGNIFDTGASIPLSPVYTDAAITDFAVHSMFNRAFITPQNLKTGINGKNLIVYSGNGGARLAGGAPPGVAAGFAAASAGAGNGPDAGNIIFSVVFETDTGFITQALNNFILYNSPGGLQVTISNIPTGGGTVVARRIIATRVFQTAYSGRYRDYAYFFVPGGRIADNVTTSITLNFFSNDLVSDSTYLLDIIQNPPAFLGLNEYNGALVGWGENANPHLLRVSISGNPESFSSTSGLLQIAPGDFASIVGLSTDQGGLKNCVPMNGNLYLHKSVRTYYVRDDGSGQASNWSPIEIDKGIGAELFSTSKVMDTEGSNVGQYLVGSPGGIYLFNGSFNPQPLTYKIQDDWDSIVPQDRAYTNIVIDSVAKRVYITGKFRTQPNTQSGKMCIMMGDFSEGLDPQSIKWSYWVSGITIDSLIGFLPGPDNPGSDGTLAIYISTNTTNLFYSLNMQHSVTLGDYADFSSGTPYVYPMNYSIPYIEGDGEGGICHLSNIRIRATLFNAGPSPGLALRLQEMDKTLTQNPNQFNLVTTVGKEYERLANFKAMKPSLQISTNSFDQKGIGCTIGTIRLFVRQLWKSYAQ